MNIMYIVGDCGEASRDQVGYLGLVYFQKNGLRGNIKYLFNNDALNEIKGISVNHLNCKWNCTRF